ncbi:hypothetical protein LNP05_06165 [Klebsiella pneumoniae subsp. pneumoniae]|nr:hypothetical protein [Klebsiella pneumoniae subsp. pneumoniae]
MVYWQKLILLLQRWQRFAAAINRTFRLAESLKNAATPGACCAVAKMWRCGRRGCRRRLAAGQTDPAPAGCMAGRCRSRESRCPPPARETLIALARLSAEP